MTAKAKRNPAKPASDVALFLRALNHPLKAEIVAVREVILAAGPGITEAIKWNAPSFRTEKEFFATLNLRAKEDVQVIFHLGAKTRPDLKPFSIADANGLMRWLGKDRALVTLGSGPGVRANRQALAAIVRAWIKHV